MFENFLYVCKDVTKTAHKIPQKEYLTAGTYKIFDQGKSYVGGYCNSTKGVATDFPYIVFGDHTRVIKYIEEPCYIGADGVKLLKVFNQDFLPKYVYYAMLANPIEHQGYSRHFKLLKETSIRKVEKEKQVAIVSELDKINQAIFLKKSEHAYLDDLVKSRFIEMFGDPIKNSKRLPTVQGETLFKLSNGKALPSNERFSEGIPAYGGNGVSWYTDKILCDFDTIIVGRVGFQSGNVHLAKAPLWITDNAMYISNLNTEICDMRFLCALIEHIDFTRYQDAGDLKKITQKPFMQMHYPMPSMQSQMQYIDFSEQIDKSKFIVQKQIGDLQELLDSKMDEYFG